MMDAPRSVSRQRRHALKRRKDGKCVVGGCPFDSGESYRCAQHKEDHRAREMERRKRG